MWVISIDEPFILLQAGWEEYFSFFVKLSSFVTQPEVKALTRRLWIAGNVTQNQKKKKKNENFLKIDSVRILMSHFNFDISYGSASNA